MSSNNNLMISKRISDFIEYQKSLCAEKGAREKEGNGKGF